MPRFAVLPVLLGRLGGRGALDNVSDVISARARVDAQVAQLEIQVAQLEARAARAA